jgi:hypothetical protein
MARINSELSGLQLANHLFTSSREMHRRFCSVFRIRYPPYN